MKRDMELVRKVLIKIEETVNNTAEYNIKVDDYSMDQIAYHCALLFEGGFIHDYEGQYGSGELYSFGVGRLTWEGHDFLDKIRSDTVWNKTKETITKQGLPMVIDVIKDISTSVISAMVEGAIKGMSQC
ncbi:DUF2513 domain-containing protein [Clostridium sp. WB02_MRS01]|uniref:DUF2513 domain-containing protein n=1 Tax=Clostridium sp. WB02_MRS01 TaxID=2605777 RepID=UPI0012B37CC7|nr:DUF2513 domain-containing protein [Clostridium sp. WB02_MRS01]MSS11741.1 DUF2513 domain-containing protein [Clostridium sp. WB02_MRS01]